MEPTESDLGLLKSVFEANDDPKDTRILRWRYLQNPTSALWVDFAVDRESKAIAGVYCVSPARFKIGDADVLGVQSIDTLTDHRHRGKGLFKKLAVSTYGRCTDDGVALVYGFPNGSSAFGFFERLGWTKLDPVPFLVRPLRLGYLARRAGLPASVIARMPDPPIVLSEPILSGTQDLRVILDFDEEFDALWARCSAGVTVALQRSARYLSWRFAKNPVEYKMLGLYERGELRGYVVVRLADKHGGRVGYVMELLYDPGRDDVGAALLRQALREIADGGGEVVLAWSLPHSFNHGAYRAHGFFPLPERLRPIELHFGARHLRASEAAVCNRRSWYLSYCDSDTV